MFNRLKKLTFILFFACLISTATFAINKIEINTASLQQLDELAGVGPAIAQRIIDARPFSSINDLDRVKGIGTKILQKIKDQGLACVNCQTQSQTPSPLPTIVASPTPSPLISPTPVPAYATGVFINEILPSPKGSDETDEWIELYNSNNIDIDLSNWKIQDRSGTITTYTIPNITKIMANNFLVFKRPDTKILLNNDGDGLNLLTPDDKIEDSINFNKAPIGQSYTKTPDQWAWSTTLTPGTRNIITAVLGVKTTSAQAGLSKANNSVKNDGVAQELAGISQSININQDESGKTPWFLFFIVLAITIILAVVVLLIKSKLNHVRT